MNIPSFRELQAIITHENGEPLIDLQKENPRLWCDYRRKESKVNSVLVRKTVAEKLQQVQEKLKAFNSSMQLIIVEGYRHPMYQERYYLQQFREICKNNPHLELEELIEQANQCVALPSVAGHPTGGAVDLTIAYEGKEVNMGCAIANFDTRHLA